MVGKRKRSQEESEQSDGSLLGDNISLPLTSSSLAALNAQAQQEEEDSHSVRTFPFPFENMAFQTPAKPVAQSYKSAANETDAEAILDIFRIFLNRQLPMPVVLQELVQKLQVPRNIPITPNSKMVRATKVNNTNRNEETELLELVDFLLYPVKKHPLDEGGEPLVHRMINQQWTTAVPRPPEYKDDKDLQEAMSKFGSPARAKPDICYGYNNEALGAYLTRYRSLPKDCLVHSESPWAPYLVVQWKSGKGTPLKAEIQARRDAATAIGALYQFFKQKSLPGYEPSPALTCVFSLVVQSSIFEYRLHWRRIGGDGEVSYEGDVIAEGFFRDEKAIFQGRSVILKTLEWARGERLVAIQKKLETLGSAKTSSLPQSHPPPTPPSASGKQSKKVKSSHEGQESGDDHEFQEEE
ncbi:MAG: hypothetical protein Q9172_003105 [Xanthocarpia lactea]